jgi:hypothetical protein
VLEIENVLQVGATPFVDRLIRVADDADVAVFGRQQPRQLVLRDVRVLELVDHDVQEALLVTLAHFRVVAEHRHDAQDQVVEVQGVALGEHLLVALVRPRDDLGEVIRRR